MRKFKRIFYLSILILVLYGLFACNVIGNKDDIKITLNGEPEIVINYGGEYIDEGVTIIKNGIDVSDEAVITSDLNTNILGVYEIDYQFQGQSMRRRIIVEDTEPPSIILDGSTLVYIAVDETYDDPSYTCIDNCDGDITDKVTVQTDINTAQTGQYTITYTVTDSNGNAATTQRTIIVETSPLSYSVAEFNLDNMFENTILKETVLSEPELAAYMADTYFIGDSRNCWLLWQGCVDKQHVWGVKSLDQLNIDKLKIERFDTGEKALALDMIVKYQPKRVVFTMGVDCVGSTPPDVIVAHYKDFLLAVMEQSPDTEIIVHNIMPVDGFLDTKDKRAWAPTNKKINDVNYLIAKMCEDLGIHFLYSAPILKDENGLGMNKYFIKDYIHLTKTAQWMIYDYIIKHPLLYESLQIEE